MLSSLPAPPNEKVWNHYCFGSVTTSTYIHNLSWDLLLSKGSTLLECLSLKIYQTSSGYYAILISGTSEWLIFPTIITRSSCTNHIVISTWMICSRMKWSISGTKTHLFLLLWFLLFICTNKSLESVGLPGLKVACWEWFKGVRKQRTQQFDTVDYTGVESHL